MEMDKIHNIFARFFYTFSHITKIDYFAFCSWGSRDEINHDMNSKRGFVVRVDNTFVFL